MVLHWKVTLTVTDGTREFPFTTDVPGDEPHCETVGEAIAAVESRAEKRGMTPVEIESVTLSHHNFLY